MSIFDDPRAAAVIEQLVKEQGFVSYFDLLMIKEAIASTDMEKE